MANSYYNHSTAPITLSSGASALIRAEFDAVTAGFDKFPAFASNSNKALVINGAGTAITVTVGTLALAGDFILSGAFNTTFVQQANVSITLPAVSGTLSTGDEMNQGGLWGLGLSNDAGDLTNDIGIAVGGAASRDTTLTSVTYMQLGTAIVKRLDATWVTGTGQGGRSSSVALSDTTYHVFLMLVGGTTDVGFDTSLTGANLIADHTATKVRRIGSILRESGAIVLFIQRYDYFWRSVPIALFDTNNPGTAAVTTSNVGVPNGIVVEAMLNVYIADTTPTVNKFVLLTSLDQTDSAASESVSTLATDAADTLGSSLCYIKTNTSGAIRYRMLVSDADINIKLKSHGWIDQRGRHVAD